MFLLVGGFMMILFVYFMAGGAVLRPALERVDKDDNEVLCGIGWWLMRLELRGVNA